MHVTCTTEGCPAEGIAQDVPTTWEDENGEKHLTGAIVCGYCSAVLTDEITE